MADNFEERRNFPRIKLHTPLGYRIRGTPEMSNVMTEDISMGGLGFVNDNFIVPKNVVMLEINLLSRTLNPVGRVQWSTPLPHSDRYRVGIEFLEIDPEEKRYLADYIEIQRSTERKF